MLLLARLSLPQDFFKYPKPQNTKFFYNLLVITITEWQIKYCLRKICNNTNYNNIRVKNEMSNDLLMFCGKTTKFVTQIAVICTVQRLVALHSAIRTLHQPSHFH